MVRRSGYRAACWIVAATLVVGGRGAAAVALTPSRLIVFGDSLSDMGNIDDATLGVVPGSTYFDGRFSNGPAWVEWLASGLGVAPLRPSTDGGDNFAYGGAQTSGAGGIGGLFIRDLDEQLSDYRASRTVDPGALYVVWAGANDLFDGQTNVNVPVGRIVASLESLTALGARQFLVPNLPILGKIPNYNRDPAASARFDQLSHQYNATFAGAIDQLAARHGDATFYQLDVGELFSGAVANPAAWGLTNVTDPAAPGLVPGAFFYNDNRIVAHPDQYLFWDTIHPTAAGHRILGDIASRLVKGVPGDFNTDGEVDGADLALWRLGVGASNATRRQGDADGDRDVDGADFLAWQQSLGMNLVKRPRGATAAGVPEPGSAGLLVVAASALAWMRRSRGAQATDARPCRDRRRRPKYFVGGRNRGRSLALMLCTLLAPATLMAAQPLARSTPEAQGVPSAAVLAFVEALDEIDQMNSFMLVRHGQVIAEGWWAPYKASDPHMLYSLSKSFTSTAVGLAIAEGKLSLDDPVVSFFPDEAPADASDNVKSMRVRDLLSMNSGQHAEDVGAFRFDGPQPLTKAFLALPVAHKPGTHFVYNTPATYMCSAIVQKVTGEKIVDYLRPRLFEPLGIAPPVWEESADGVSLGGYGLNVTTEDIAKFGQLYLQRGKWQGMQLVPADWVEMATARQVSNGSSPASDWEQGYGFQFWRCRHGAYRGDGAFGQYCLVMPEQDAVLAITSGVADMQSVLNVVWEKLLPALTERQEPLPADEATLGALQKRVATLEVAAPAGDRATAVGDKISGAVFEFPANDLKLESLKLDAGDGSTVLTLQVQGKEHVIPCGFGAWTKGAMAPRLGDPRAAGAEARVAAAGAWTADDRYQAKLCLYETPYYLTLTLGFAEEQVTFDAEYNVSFGPRKLPQLIGQRRLP